MSTAFLHRGGRQQRLQASGTNAPHASGSQERDPRVLWPARLHWHSNSGGKQHGRGGNTTPGHRAIQGNCKRKLTAKTAASANGILPSFSLFPTTL